MRDWNAYALERLSSLPVAPAKKQAVALELGEHLAECYAELLSRGVSDDQAFLETCAQVGAWEELREGIFAATKEVTMIDRLKQIWGPVALTFVFGYAALMFLDVARARGVMSHVSAQRGLAVYLPWLCVLALVGAAVSYVSRHSRCDGWRVYFAASFPVLVLAAVLLALVLGVAATDPQRAVANPSALGLLVVSWVVLPGLALCSGVALQGFLGTRAPAQ